MSDEWHLRNLTVEDWRTSVRHLREALAIAEMNLRDAETHERGEPIMNDVDRAFSERSCGSENRN